MKYQFIRDNTALYPVTLMCDVLEVSRAGYYDWRDRPASQTALRHQQLAVQAKDAFIESRQTYGSPRITLELADRGFRASRNTIAKIMRQEGLVARTPRRFIPRTTDSSHLHPIAENHLDRQFAPGNEAPAAWVSDITYVPTQEGWLYLAAVMDLRTRRIVGWAMADHMRVELVLEALHMAILRLKPGEELLHHSDRGSQYACLDYRAALAAHGIKASMSRTGNCYDNAVMESFWATAKVEEIYRQEYATREQAKAAIFEYIEIFYNRKRRHSALGYLSPEAFAARLN
jgi:transposase InsO family protein